MWTPWPTHYIRWRTLINFPLWKANKVLDIQINVHHTSYLFWWDLHLRSRAGIIDCHPNGFTSRIQGKHWQVAWNDILHHFITVLNSFASWWIKLKNSSCTRVATKILLRFWGSAQNRIYFRLVRSLYHLSTTLYQSYVVRALSTLIQAAPVNLIGWTDISCHSRKSAANKIYRSSLN